MNNILLLLKMYSLQSTVDQKQFMHCDNIISFHRRILNHTDSYEFNIYKICSIRNNYNLREKNIADVQ